MFQESAWAWAALLVVEKQHRRSKILSRGTEKTVIFNVENRL